MNNPFCSHNIIASDTSNLPPYSGKLQEYWMAGNGVFLRSHRREIEVCLPVANSCVDNLPHIQPYFRLVPPKVPALTISEIIHTCQEAGEREVLFYLDYTNQWQLHVPAQTASRTSVAAMESSFNSNYETALIEIHSHARAPARFSTQDDIEESGKFRIFAVIGSLPDCPAISVRLGVYDRFFDIPNSWIFTL
ncbi:Mov34/MPN/PAD-1 family protein [Chroococcidiopsis sp. FACHB-1243]|uniref:Mov34/MPN/PAD-1 family protein n=1 Tax=Chroococcidiopsis sp. [FACHB-1243] TaxID=2692781 RepID=UPI0017825486|nr:Mov34/MPN/PAD-1 family protein [Chroococcidiopsis sp. [FACHB-1243]]MBD2307778.1 Mov34/MPN/PAD-1 family protein [Chroococcidiopsis sp. [FACHB-1243]]